MLIGAVTVVMDKVLLLTEQQQLVQVVALVVNMLKMS
jgi:hypothetical protein